MSSQKLVQKTVKTSEGFAIAALIVGIVAFLFGWVAFASTVVGSVAVVLAILGLKRNQSKGMSISGLVLGSIGAITSLIVGFFLVIGFGFVQTIDGQSTATNSQESPTPEDQKESEIQIIDEGFFGSYMGFQYWVDVQNSSQENVYLVKLEYDVFGAADEIVSVDRKQEFMVPPNQTLRIFDTVSTGNEVVPVKTDMKISLKVQSQAPATPQVLVSDISFRMEDYGAVTVTGEVVNNSQNELQNWFVQTWCLDDSNSIVAAEYYWPPAGEDLLDPGETKPFLASAIIEQGRIATSCAANLIEFTW